MGGKVVVYFRMAIRCCSANRGVSGYCHASVGVSETGSAKTGSAIDIRIDDAGSILNFRIGPSL